MQSKFICQDCGQPFQPGDAVRRPDFIRIESHGHVSAYDCGYSVSPCCKADYDEEESENKTTEF